MSLQFIFLTKKLSKRRLLESFMSKISQQIMETELVVFNSCLKEADPGPGDEGVGKHEGDGKAHPGGIAEGGPVVPELLVEVAEDHQVGRRAGHHPRTTWGSGMNMGIVQ